MGQQRTDSNQQLAAKQRVADSRRCSHCHRRSAMSSQRGSYDDGHVWKVCNYCGFERGRTRDYGSEGAEWTTYEVAP